MFGRGFVSLALALILACAPTATTTQGTRAGSVVTPTPVPTDVPARTTSTAAPTTAPTVAPRVVTSAPTAPPTPAPTLPPTPVPTVARTVAPAQPPAAPFVTITSSGWGRISASTVPGAACTVRVRFPSGSVSTAQGVQGTVIASTAGSVSWSYNTTANTLKGTGTNTVTCIVGGQSVSASAAFTVQ